jgi:hypothetical protein
MTEFAKNSINQGDPPPGSGAVRLDDLLGLSSSQSADNPLPGSGAMRLDDLLNPPSPPSPPLRQAFETRVDVIMRMRGLPRLEAEPSAYEAVLIEFLNATHPDTPSDRCAHCVKLEESGAPLLPIGLGVRHTWLHNDCWEQWRARRRDRAEDELARLGVVKP